MMQASRFRHVAGAKFSPEFAASYGVVLVVTLLGALAMLDAMPKMGLSGAILVFGAVALIALGAVQAYRFKNVKGALFSPEFATSYGLILVATIGGALALPKDTTGAFTLFGLIAGYLAGTKVTEAAAQRNSNRKKDDDPPAKDDQTSTPV